MLPFMDDETTARWAEMAAAEQPRSTEALGARRRRMISTTEVSTSSRPLAAALHLPNVKRSERRVRERVDDRIDHACVLAHEPAVLLLDKPSSGIGQREADACVGLEPATPACKGERSACESRSPNGEAAAD